MSMKTYFLMVLLGIIICFPDIFVDSIVICELLLVDMMDDFDIFSSVARSASGISAGFLDKVLDGKLTLTDSSSTETWKM